MAELFGVRANGLFRTDTTGADDNINRDWQITFTPSAQADFYNLIGLSPAGDYSTYFAKQEYFVDAASIFTTQENTSAGVFRSRPSLWVEKRNLTAASHTFKTNCYGNNVNSGAGAMGNSSVFWNPADTPQFTSLASYTTNQTTFQDALTLTFTPPNTQDYLIIVGVSGCYAPNSAATIYTQLLIDGAVYGSEQELGYNNASGYGQPPLSFLKLINLSNASHTIKIQGKSSNTAYTNTWQNLFIIAIPLGNLTHYSNEGSTPQTTTSNAWSDAATITFSPGSDSWYLVLGYGEADNNTNCGVRLLVDGQIHAVNNLHPNGTNNKIPFGIQTIEKVKSGTNKTIKLQFCSPDNSSTARINNPRIVAIDVGAIVKQIDVHFRASTGADPVGVNNTNYEVQCQMVTPTLSASANPANVGQNSSNQKVNIGMVIEDVDVKQGVTLTSAYVIVNVYTANGTYATIVKVFNEDNTAVFSTAADYTARARAATTGNFTLSSTGWLKSGDLASVFNQVFARAGFAQGNNIGFELDGGNFPFNTLAAVNSEDYSSYDCKAGGIYLIWQEIIAQVTPVNISDAGSGLDSIADISASIPISEAGSVSELLSILNTLALSDLGNGIDIPSPVGLFNIADSGGLSLETLNILAQIALTDSGIASEALSLLVSLALSDASVNATKFYSLADDGEISKTGQATWSEARDATVGSGMYTGTVENTIASSLSGGLYSVYRIFMFFDTTAIPAGVTIKEVKLIYYAGFWQTNSPKFYVVASTANKPMTTDDFDQRGSVSFGSDTPPTASWRTINFNQSGIDAIVKGGITKLALIHDNDYTNTAPTVANDLVVRMTEDTNKPYLSITIEIDVVSILVDLVQSDSGVGSDVLSILALVAQSDSGSTSEALSILSQIALSDTGASSEALDILASIALSETGAGSDVIAVDTGYTPINVSDTGSGSEALNILAQIALLDTGVASEALSLLVAIALSDTGAASEALNILVDLAVSDTGVGSDVVNMLGLVAISDTGILAAETVDILAQLAVSDSGVASEVITILSDVAVSESGSSSEAFSVLASIAVADIGSSSDEAISILASLAVSDTGVASEALTILGNLAISDAGAGSEVLAVLASIAVSESSLGSDAVQILASVVVNEAGLASEAVSLLAQVAQGDTGAATEALSVFISLAVADTGVGSEILSILASNVLSDAGSGSDALSILAEVAVSDSGLASEAI